MSATRTRKLYYWPEAPVLAAGQFLIFVDAVLTAVIPYRWNDRAQVKRTPLGRWGCEVECWALRRMLKLQGQ